MEIEMIERPETALTVQDRAAVALNASKTEADLKALALKNTHIVAVIDKPGRDQTHGAAMELKRARIDIEKASKDARDDATKFSKAVIQEEKRLVAIIEPEETRLLGLRDGWDDTQARIKAETDRIERARVTAIHEEIAGIRSFGALALQCRTAARIAGLIETLTAMRSNGYDSFQEFGTEAEQVLVSTMQTITNLYTEKQGQELEAARVKAEQEALAASLAAERAALDKERAELAAARKAIEDAKPKAEPVPDAYDKDLQAYLAAVQAPVPAPAITVIDGPMSVSKGLRAQFDKTYPIEVWNPSDMQILDALCQHFNKSERLVYERLACGFDLEALNAAAFEDVPL